MSSEPPAATDSMAMNWERRVEPQRAASYRVDGAEAAYRRHVVRANITLAAVALLIAPPIIIFLLIGAIVMRFPLIEASVVTYILGMGVTGVIVSRMARGVARRSDGRLTDFLHKTFEPQGLNGGEHVGLRHSVGEGVLAQVFERDHDTGLLFIYDSEVVLEGMRSRHRLVRSQVKGAIARTIGSPSLLGGHWCVIQMAVEDDGPPQDYYLQLRPAGRSSSTDATEQFVSRVNQWAGATTTASS